MRALVTSRAIRVATLKAATYLCMVFLGTLAGCANDFGIFTKKDLQYLPVANCFVIEPTVSFTTLVDGAAVCGSLRIDFIDTNPRDTVHQVSLDNDKWITASSGVTMFSGVPGFGSQPTGAGITLYIKGESPCNTTQVDVIKTEPTVSISSPTPGTIVFGNETISFSDTVSTTYEASIDQATWVSATSGSTLVSDVTGFSALADDATFTLYMRDDNSSCNLASVSLKKAGPAAFLNLQMIVLDTTAATGASVGNDVNAFPVLLRHTLSSIYNAVRPDAHDIRFRLASGQWLDYEVEFWDQLGLDPFAVWVLVPTVYGNNKTQTISMYYGEAVTDSIPDGQSPGRVFNIVNGFAGVWHMSDNPVTGSIKDSTSNHFNGTPSGMNSGNGILGLVGHCLNFDGSNDLISLGAHTALQPANITLSFWIYRNTSWASAWVPLYGKETTYSSNGWQFYTVPNGADSIAASLYVDGNNYFYINTDPNTFYPLNTWVHVALSFNTSTKAGAIYKNGVAQTVLTQGTCNTITSSVSTITKVAQDDGSACWPGQMDELRISNVVRSADWVKLSYENQKTGQTLVKWQ